jgi:hypothetical protein
MFLVYLLDAVKEENIISNTTLKHLLQSELNTFVSIYCIWTYVWYVNYAQIR